MLTANDFPYPFEPLKYGGYIPIRDHPPAPDSELLSVYQKGFLDGIREVETTVRGLRKQIEGIGR